MAERVGKKRATVANYLRLLKLPAEIQVGIKEKKIDMGHARAILATPSAERQLALYQRILREGLSVRKVEELAQNVSLALNTKVKVANGKVVISYSGEEELARITEKLI